MVTLLTLKTTETLNACHAKCRSSINVPQQQQVWFLPCGWIRWPPVADYCLFRECEEMNRICSVWIHRQKKKNTRSVAGTHLQEIDWVYGTMAKSVWGCAALGLLACANALCVTCISFSIMIIYSSLFEIINTMKANSCCLACLHQSSDVLRWGLICCAPYYVRCL